MNEQELQQWLTTYVAQLAPSEQQAVTAAWGKLSAAQKNQVVSNAQGGPAEYEQQALTVIQQAQQGPATAPPPAMKSATQPFNAAATGASQAASAATPYAQTELLGPSGAVSTTSVGAGSTPVQGTSQAAALINQYMTTPLWQGDPNDPQGAADGLGLDYTSAHQQYEQYYQSFQAAQARIGNDSTRRQASPMQETQFMQGLAQAQYGKWGPVIGMLAYAYQEQNGSAMPAALAQAVLAGLKKIPQNDAIQLQAQMLNSIEQISSAAKNVTAKGGQATNLNMNVEVTSFLSQLATYAPSVYSGTAGSTAGALAAASPSSVVGQYMTAYPAAAGIEAAQKGTETANAVDFLNNYGVAVTPANITALSNAQTYANMGAYVAWMQKIGMPITPGVLQELMAMPFGDPNSATVSAGSGGAFLLDQKVPGTAMTYGTYQQVSSQITPQWQQYFNTTPTKQQLAFFAGKSQQDITDYFDNSQSSVPGVTIGVKNDYEQFINTLDTSGATTHAFSSGVDDSLIKQLHDHLQSQSTGTATPGPMQ